MTPEFPALMNAWRLDSQKFLGNRLRIGQCLSETESPPVKGKEVSRLRGLGIRAVAGLAVGLWAGIAYARIGYADPAGSGVIVSAVRWLEGTLLGTIATIVAVIAVASVGLLMLTGRINWRYGATVILGCFILFGAASIVGGIQSAASLGQ
jgi:type IV secretion system protein VirB2